LGTPCPAGKTSTPARWLGQAAHTDLPGFKNLEGLAKPEGRPDGRAAYRLPENGRLLNVCSRSKDTAAALWGGWKMSEEGSARRERLPHLHVGLAKSSKPCQHGTNPTQFFFLP